MSYQVIQLPALPIQQFSTTLDNQTAQFTLTTTDVGLFADIVYNGNSIAAGRLCLDRTNLNGSPYTGLPKGLFFVDLLGTTDPVYAGFGTRYLLLYGDPNENGGVTYP
jgi:hypothetical protein